jgi:uncharacterized protein (DUF1684 family)
VKFLLSFSLALFFQAGQAQLNIIYLDSMKAYRANYIQTHEIVGKDDRKFLQFFPIDPSYKVECRFEEYKDGRWFQMSTSGKMKQVFRTYGKLNFLLRERRLTLYIYQSQYLINTKGKENILFIPFTDSTSGEESYGGGRYLDCTIQDIKNDRLTLDFNKAYNPYCAYTTGYNCPIPPRENNLPVSVRAGEKLYSRNNH